MKKAKTYITFVESLAQTPKEKILVEGIVDGFSAIFADEIAKESKPLQEGAVGNALAAGLLSLLTTFATADETKKKVALDELKIEMMEPSSQDSVKSPEAILQKISSVLKGEKINTEDILNPVVADGDRKLGTPEYSVQ